jgi:hypothetical protein
MTVDVQTSSTHGSVTKRVLRFPTANQKAVAATMAIWRLGMADTPPINIPLLCAASEGTIAIIALM